MAFLYLYGLLKNQLFMKCKNDCVRSLNRDEFDQLLELASLEGWNPGINDADSFYNSDPDGFMGYYIKGKLIGCISAVAYDEDFGFMGFFIVKPDYRNMGYGKKLWSAALNYLGDCNIGLDGTLEMKEKYEAYGFKEAYKSTRYKIIAKKLENAGETIPLKQVNFANLVKFDHLHFPTRRDVFLYNWIHQSEGQSFAVCNDEKIEGYTFIRKGLDGFRIGPLFALTPEVADTLFCKAISWVPEGTPVYLDVPEINPEALNLAVKYQMEPGFKTVRMYTQKAPHINMKGVYAVTNLELG
jgi:ribosomal protein S18 acetylase RimI-like enzyme